MIHAVLIRYGEIYLKRGRRDYFMGALTAAVRAAVSEIPQVAVHLRQPRLFVTDRRWGPDDPDHPLGDRVEAVCRAVERVFGVESISPASLCGDDIEAIAALAVAMADAERLRLPRARTFRVAARREDKRYPMRSPEIARRVGDAVGRANPDLTVDLSGADITIGVEIRPHGSAVTATPRPGPGGLPVGTNGDALLLLSGGYDSPVAGWLAMKRGVRVDALYFHAFPYTSDQTRRKVTDLARVLSRWQCGPLRLFVAPFAPFQEVCRERVRPRDRVLVYRRQMMRVANRVAAEHGHLALVTGEAIGQVASQTLENIGTIEHASALPVLRPLVASDKPETLAMARRIGTHDVSAEPYDDCCSLFVPARPELRGRPGAMEWHEERLPIDELTAECLAGIETVEL